MQTFTHDAGDIYVVTGRYYNSNRRFRLAYSNPHMALGINLWNGSVWQEKFGSNKRTLIKRVVN